MAGPIGPLHAISYQSNTGGGFDAPSGPDINNSGFGYGMLSTGMSKTPATSGNGNPRVSENGMRFMGSGSSKGNPRGGHLGEGMHGAILIYENTGS